MNYINRLTDNKIKSYLKPFGTVLIEGPKYFGKTRSCEELTNTKIYFQNPTDKKRLKAIIDEALSLIPHNVYALFLFFKHCIITIHKSI